MASSALTAVRNNSRIPRSILRPVYHRVLNTYRKVPYAARTRTETAIVAHWRVIPWRTDA
ncbi:hypothetical protein NN4_38240 [Nocardia ninae NBRC 108245]|uniref:Uncharacterized protein n=1 Tax=Nocardia ninae NBRC 108245 TaxID=1210091 RepID=A0A511MF54_9NOCA|nr:hypothetical protein NN4_38240 [Nocardia ninae NBRC 108245]